MPKKVHRATVATVTAFLLGDDRYLSIEALVDLNRDCYAEIGGYAAADVINKLRKDMVTVNRQSSIVLDIMIDGRRFDDQRMVVAPLDQQYELVLGRRWIEELEVRLENGNLVWLDCRNKKPDDSPAEDIEDPDIHLQFNLDEVREEGRMIDGLIQQLCELEENSDQWDIPVGMPLSREILEKLYREDTPVQISSLESHEQDGPDDQNISVAMLLSPKIYEEENKTNTLLPEEVTSSPHESYDEDQGNCKSRITDALPGDQTTSTCQEEDLYQPRTLITDDQRLGPLVRLPEISNFLLLQSGNAFSAKVPVAPMITSKETQVTTEVEAMVVSPTVRFPGHYRGEDERNDSTTSGGITWQLHELTRTGGNRNIVSVAVAPPPENYEDRSIAIKKQMKYLIGSANWKILAEGMPLLL
jgi:hypothetical protein